MAGQQSKGFSEFEFLGLIAVGLLIAGILAHFVFDQSIQVERLNALVHRDTVRLEFETRITDPDVIAKSVMILPNNHENEKLRACILGGDDKSACVSREHFAVPIVALGESVGILAGANGNASCLSETGDPMQSGSTCFASAEVTLEPLCLSGEISCRKAHAVLIHYRLDFQPAFLKAEPALASLERTVSLVLVR